MRFSILFCSYFIGSCESDRPQRRMISDQIPDPMISLDVYDKFLSNEKGLVPQLLSFNLLAKSLVIIGRKSND